jgi:peptidoglycan/LPS O-acetylase OafA/YrhL
MYAARFPRVSRVTDHGLAAFVQSIHEFFWAHLIAISLEWQFYLIAPFAIVLAQRRYLIVWFALAVGVLECAYQLQFFGSFVAPSFLPAAAGYFALGIASRIAYPTFTGITQPTYIVALFLVLVPLGWEGVPLLVWALVLTGMTLNRTDARTVSFARAYHWVLEGRIPTYFGSRSYSTYLSHFPILTLCHSLWLSAFPLASSTLTFIGLSLMTVPATLIASELLYRGIELPGIALGSWLARRSAVVSFPRSANPFQTIAGRQPLQSIRD